MVLINKFNKKILILVTPFVHQYIIPGGAPFVFENARKAASRLFFNLTNMKFESVKMTKILEEYVGRLQVTTFVTFYLDKYSKLANKNMYWIHMKYLQSYFSALWAEYYKKIYLNLIQHVH